MRPKNWGTIREIVGGEGGYVIPSSTASSTIGNAVPFREEPTGHPAAHIA